MNQSGKCCSWQWDSAITVATSGVLTISIIFAFADSIYAQTPSVIIPDNNLGDNQSQVIKNYEGHQTEAITGGVTRNQNLFHSFQEFNVAPERSALFLSPSNIQNILVRVTGNNPSEIFGKIETSVGSSANLFLINPKGIIFGSNSSLNLSGSFIASTANAIKFTDGELFSATDHQSTSPLSINVPVGLQFNGTGTGIRVNKQSLSNFLQVLPGKTLALIGGNVNVDGGNLLAFDGQIVVGGISGLGTINLDLDNKNQPFHFPNNVLPADISISKQAILFTTGEGGGKVYLHGKLVDITDESAIVADTEGSKNGRGIFIQAEQLIVRDEAYVRASTYDNGAGGNIVIKATESVLVGGYITNKLSTGERVFPSALLAESFGKGSAGNLEIETKNLIVENGGQIAASTRMGSQGLGGKIKVIASDSIQLNGSQTSQAPTTGLFAQTYSSRDAGSLTINTRELIVKNGAQIVAGTQPNSQGNGGSLIINASDLIELSGIAPNGVDTSGLFARSRGSGNAGSLSITTGKLIVRDQAQVTVSALKGGDAGNLDIKADEIHLDEKGKLVAETTLGNGGNINLDLKNSLLLLNNSAISTTAGTDAEGRGNGGNILINIPNGFIVAVPGEDSNITANAFKGQGGNVSINAFSVFGIEFREKESPLTNDITASSEFGLNGTVEINTPEVQPDQGLINLPTQPVEPRLAQVCQAVAGRNQDSFTITGRGGLPNNPNELLYSDAVLTDWVAVSNVENIPNTPISKSISTPTQTNIVEATGWVISPQGEVVLTVNTPNTKSPNSWQKTSACNS
ncbi:filamentous hemagglutinin N-terminal domain-containing protein [Anabaena sp. CCY 9910]|uniref:two-partner secretion domain-containing protein n=1 Tax=Anabaena sp. CCY 9910 TaxID=3103870 RepID=UPI0039E109EA